MGIRHRIVGLVTLAFVVAVVAVPTGVSATEEITTSWTTEQFTLADGRTYYARVPGCAPAESQGCLDHLARPRQALVFMHGAGGAEDAATATTWTDFFAKLRNRDDTVYVYAVSQDGTRRWNGGICCTFDEVDDVGYLADLAADVSTRTSIRAGRVGLFGASNGGMLALRAECERPDTFGAAMSWAGTFAGDCSAAAVEIGQLHGAADTVVPVTGGTTTIYGHSVDIPPAASMAERMLPGTRFPLTVMPGWGHRPNWYVFVLQIQWLSARLR